ncbi:Outer membrane cobalamin receptor translocator, tonB dependent [Cupriavidus taiwanensis]|uniref:TonB-dependent receptor domain-containing protein n=1 Tax=Cupriavidus taiwanensis TaxID=164546 RepID=UPI000E13A949|nr:TonB-dependent receptor [Cupriavidus taiwanensis]SOZ98566.1 Outer membrane cobalamin receptor translocator, tonB dependent [Cupriavidus taiwanensis]
MRSSLHRSTRPASPAVRPSVPAILAAMASFTLVPGTASAQAADSRTAQLAPVVVTSSRTAQSITEALPHTTVVTQQDIANAQAPDLRTLLRSQAGVEFATNGGMGSNTSLFMRGANSNQTLILVDGVRVSSASSGTAQLANILPDQIDRIEVVRGNVSALYGSDAIGGVVQIFTKSGAGQAPAANAAVEYGSNNTRQGTVGYGGQVGDTSFNLTGSAFKTDGFSSINTRQAPRANPNDNPYENQSVSGQVKHRFTPSWDAGITGYYSKSKLSFDSAFGRPTDDNRTNSELYTLSAFVNGKLGADWTTHFKLSQSEDRSDTFLNSRPNGTFNTRNRQFNWQNEYALAAGHTLLFGTDYLQQELDSSAYGAPTRNVFSVFGGYDGRFGKHQLQLNARNDHYSDFGNQGSFFAGYGYNLTDAFKLIASVSNAFRAPTFNELYYPNFGQPNLQPERAKSVEAGVQYTTASAGLLRVTAFETRYHDLIVSAQQPNGMFLAQNVNQAKVQGIEASWRASVYGTDIGASVTFQNPVDEQTNTQLLRRARRHAALDVGRNFGNWRFGGEWLLSSSRMDAGSRRLGGYGIVSLNARYNIDKQWFIAARVENLFDKDYQLAYPYNTQGRAGFITLGWRQR